MIIKNFIIQYQVVTLYYFWDYQNLEDRSISGFSKDDKWFDIKDVLNYIFNINKNLNSIDVFISFTER